MGIRLYCGINEKTWNGVPVIPGPYACISPVYGSKETTRRVNSVKVPLGVEVLQDSGAFSDSLRNRLSLCQALDRQKRHADKYGYADQITHRVIYDVLIDEVWSDSGDRTKRRWTVAEAEQAVMMTVDAARYLDQNRDGLSIVTSAQGVDVEQYTSCVERLLPYWKPGDIFGLGGWCITGRMPKVMMPVFRPTMRKIIPILSAHQVNSVHIFGVIYAPALAELLYMCNQYNIQVSTDSAGPSYRPAFGSWGFADWIDSTYIRKPTGWWRGIDRVLHVEATRQWLNAFEQSPAYIETSKGH